MLRIEPHFHFIKHRKTYYIVSIVLISTGLLIGGIRGFNYGIDFTGGTMIHLNMGEQVSTQDVKDVFEKYDVDTSQMEIVFSGDKLDEIIIKTREALDNEQRKVIINEMESTFGITQEDVLGIELFGPSVGKELQGNAIKAILLASLGMLLYMRFRFREWKFGGAALLGVLHDVLLVVAFYAVFQITVNNPFIAGILTVLGYSINDTIVIFDRIRENLHLMKKDSTEVILDTSVNQTISRSVMTGLNAILIMIPLYIMTGPAIREFVLPLMVGISVGTLSSIFVCSPLYYDFSSFKRKSGYLKHAEKSKRKKASSYLPAESKKIDKLPEKRLTLETMPEDVIVANPETIQIPSETQKTGPIKTTKHNKKGKKNKR
jgi:SecD/SecF fusion protein